MDVIWLFVNVESDFLFEDCITQVVERLQVWDAVCGGGLAPDFVRRLKYHIGVSSGHRNVATKASRYDHDHS
jgi:hypothetical protein